MDRHNKQVQEIPLLTPEEQQYDRLIREFSSSKQKQLRELKPSLENAEVKLTDVIALLNALKQLKEAITDPDNNPEDNPALVASRKALNINPQEWKKLKSAMEQFIPTATNVCNEMEKLIFSFLTPNEIPERKNDLYNCVSMLTAMSTFIKDPTNIESLKALISQKQALNEAYNQQPNKKINKLNLNWNYAGMFIGKCIMLTSVLLAGPSMGASLALIAVGGAIFAASAGQPITMLGYEQYKSNTRSSQLRSMENQAATLLGEIGKKILAKEQDSRPSY